MTLKASASRILGEPATPVTPVAFDGAFAEKGREYRLANGAVSSLRTRADTFPPVALRTGLPSAPAALAAGDSSWASVHKLLADAATDI